MFKQLVRELLRGKALTVEDAADVLSLKDNVDTIEDYATALHLLSCAKVGCSPAGHVTSARKLAFKHLIFIPDLRICPTAGGSPHSEPSGGEFTPTTSTSSFSISCPFFASSSVLTHPALAPAGTPSARPQGSPTRRSTSASARLPFTLPSPRRSQSSTPRQATSSRPRRRSGRARASTA